MKLILITAVLIFISGCVTVDKTTNVLVVNYGDVNVEAEIGE